jgi:8-oxo-dGTP diphosphatase
MKRINVVFCLITNEPKTKVLMVKNAKNETWSLPGGAVEENETLDEAAVREAKEETNLDVKVHGLLAMNEAVFEKTAEHDLFITFRAEIVGGTPEIVRPNEICQMEWIDIELADQFMPYYKDGFGKLVSEGHEITYFNEGKI